MKSIIPRKWQGDFISDTNDSYLIRGIKHIFWLACPGAGKSFAAAMLSYELYVNGEIDYVIVFCPSKEIEQGLIKTFENIFGKKFGLFGAPGAIFTYQRARLLSDSFWANFSNKRVFVILDETHHLGGNSIENSNCWGRLAHEKIDKNASFILQMSGTPWRSDCLPISLAKYNKNGEIHCNYIYGLERAIKDGVCRTPKIVIVDNSNVIYKNKHLSSLTDVPDYSKLLESTAAENLMSLAIDRLDNIRVTDKNSGGLVVAKNVKHAEKLYNLITERFKRSAVLVTNKQKNANEIIDEYRNSDIEWIISVSMVSQGTDIPRLKVCCYLTSVRTELYYRQVLGRVLRVTSETPETGWLYMLSEPTLNEYANRLNCEIPEYSVIDNKSIFNPLELDLSHECDDKVFSNYNGNIDIDPSRIMEGKNLGELGENELSTPINYKDVSIESYLKFLGRYTEVVIEPFD